MAIDGGDAQDDEVVSHFTQLLSWCEKVAYENQQLFLTRAPSRVFALDIYLWLSYVAKGRFGFPYAILSVFLPILRC